MTDPFLALRRTRTGKWSVWKYNWLANHKMIRALERVRVHARGVLLDVGCGPRRFEWIFAGHVRRVVGLDLVASTVPGDPGPDVRGRAEALPFRDASMDTVLGLSVLSYMPEPGRMLEEARRVLRPGGMLILEFPYLTRLYDEPYDYYRYTRHGARWLLERSGFEIVEISPMGSLATRLGLSTIATLNRINRGPTRILTEIPVRALYVIVQLGSELLERLSPPWREAFVYMVVARRT